MKWIGLLCLYFVFNSCYADQTVECAPPQGTRIDYFNFNNINLPNNVFHMGKDRVSGMIPKIIIHDDKNISFQIGDASEMKGGTKIGSMRTLMFTQDQITFTGVVNNAPIMATYYPKLTILIYTQQSIWPTPEFLGARAVIFYAKCKLLPS